MGTLLADTKFAMELEERGYAFYSEAAQKTKNPLAISTLRSLAEREREHELKIGELYRKLEKEQPPEPHWLKNYQVPLAKKELLRPILEQLKASLNQEFKNEEDLDKIYETAKELERKSFELYEKIAAENKEEIIKQFYSSLAKEEREHYDILEETQQYLNHPADWFRKEERWIVEG